MPLSHIVTATDFSEQATFAARAAARFATRAGAKLSVVHVYSPSPPVSGALMPARVASNTGARAADLDAQAREALAQLRAGALADHDGELELVAVPHTNSVTALTEHAAASRADLLVMGTHGRTGLARLLIGSVAQHVVRHAPCPVLTMRSGVDLDTFPQNVLVCTDLSPAAESGVVLGAEVASLFEAEVTLGFVHTPGWWDADKTSGGKGVFVDTLREQLLALHRRHLGGRGRAAVLTGDSPADTIIRMAAQEKFDLVVVATHGMTGLARLVIGSVAERVTRHAPCPVLVARAATTA